MQKKEYLSISELTNLLNLTLEDYIGEIGFCGEISEITRASSGHCYLTLKDEMSQISAVVWSSKAKTLRFALDKGLKINCRGKPNVYTRSGRLQVVLSSIELAGEGDLQKKFEALKKKLEAEGLFAIERKRPLPFFPKALGIVSSAQGAVIHDIMVRLQERMPQLKVYLVDVRVQGIGAAEEIAAAIKYLEKSGLVDVMIVGRGGGSLEDLWAFNEEIVCRAIFSSSIPIISAVGHEVDFTLADFVADKRAPTPTAAAEMVVPKRSDLLQQIAEYERRFLEVERIVREKQQDLDLYVQKLEQVVRRNFEDKQQQLTRISLQIARYEPSNIIRLLQNKLELAKNKLISLTTACIKEKASGAALWATKISTERLKESLSQKNITIVRAEQVLSSSVKNIFSRSAQVLHANEMRLQSLNPEKIVQRGFAIIYKDSKVTSSVDQVEKGSSLTIRLKDGRVQTIVQNIEAKI